MHLNNFIYSTHQRVLLAGLRTTVQKSRNVQVAELAPHWGKFGHPWGQVRKLLFLHFFKNLNYEIIQ